MNPSTREKPLEASMSASMSPQKTSFEETKVKLTSSHISAVTKYNEDLTNLFMKCIEPNLGTIFGSSFIFPERFISIMSTVSRHHDQDFFPKNVIGVGSGYAILEKSFSMMNGVTVNCYGKEAFMGYLPVKKALFPGDINTVLPKDCKGCLLVANDPQGNLGPILEEFINRNGEMLCTTVETCIEADVHAGAEVNKNILLGCLKCLTQKGGECFQVKLNEGTMLGPPWFMQFFNWPAPVKTTLLNSHLARFVSDLEIQLNDEDSDSDSDSGCDSDGGCDGDGGCDRGKDMQVAAGSSGRASDAH